MNQSDIDLLNLPNEILLVILKKLDNIDVLYSLFGINNKQLDILVEDGVFTNILNFSILLAGDYPNLTSLELFNFGQEIVCRYLTDNSAFRYIFFKYQITELILHNNDKYPTRTLLKTYITNVYAHIMILFQNLKHFRIVASSINEYPPLSLFILPSTTYFSSSLSVLCINVLGFDDCLWLLDGRLK
ncbi:unnamed protein product [Rotaria sp. Silwood2]|nr:unnamed protein product [Rotaria sp. Silwood2]